MASLRFAHLNVPHCPEGELAKHRPPPLPREHDGLHRVLCAEGAIRSGPYYRTRCRLVSPLSTHTVSRALVRTHDTLVGRSGWNLTTQTSEPLTLTTFDNFEMIFAPYSLARGRHSTSGSRTICVLQRSCNVHQVPLQLLWQIHVGWMRRAQGIGAERSARFPALLWLENWHMRA